MNLLKLFKKKKSGWQPGEKFILTNDGERVKVDRFKLGDRVSPVKVGDGEPMLCPNCGSAEFLEGPSGGISMNVTCNSCHYRWNANSVGLPWDCIGVSIV